MNKPQIGILRQDLELLPPGEHGNFAMIFDPQADAYYRISETTMKIISYMTHHFEVNEFLQHLKNLSIFLTQQELISIISFLQQNNLLEPNYDEIKKKREKTQEIKDKTTLLRFSAAYLFFKLPPWRPEKFLTKVAPLITWFASKWFITLLLFPALLGFLQIIRHFSLVRTTFLDSLSWAGLAKYFIAIIILKIVHESAHAIAATHFKCRVRGIGIGFMVFYPRLFTDTTDSWRLPRRQRLLIDGAGIIIELLVGGIAALLWIYLSPGYLKSTMFYIFAVSTISTLFVNGNPCIRYDGYYLLCDIINIENLMTRSSEYIKQFWRWRFLGLGNKPQNKNGNFLLCFGVASFIYRIFLYTSIILILYHSFVKTIAVVLIFLELYSIMIYPFIKEVQTVRLLSKNSVNKARWYLAFCFFTFTGIILFFPIGWNITLPGEIAPTSQHLISINESGYLTHHFSHNTFMVKKDSPIIKLTSPNLLLNKKKIKETLTYDQYLFELQQLETQDIGNSQVSLNKIHSDKLGLKEIERREKDLQINANLSGIFIPQIPEMSRNAFLPKGIIIGKILSGKKLIYAYAIESEISHLSINQKVTIRCADSLKTFSGKISHINPIPSKLNNSPLLQHFGGPIPVYIDEKQPNHYTSVLAMFKIEIEIQEDFNWQIGRTVTVSVHHSERLWDRVKQFIISAFRREF